MLTFVYIAHESQQIKEVLSHCYLSTSPESDCTPSYMLWHVVGSCCKNYNSQHSFSSVIAEEYYNNVGNVCVASPT